MARSRLLTRADELSTNPQTTGLFSETRRCRASAHGGQAKEAVKLEIEAIVPQPMPSGRISRIRSVPCPPGSVQEWQEQNYGRAYTYEEVLEVSGVARRQFTLDPTA